MEAQETALTIETLSGAQLKIGKMNQGFINVFCNFNPIRKIRLLQIINNYTPAWNVVNIQDYENGTGGFAVHVSSDLDYATALNILETIFKTEVA